MYAVILAGGVGSRMWPKSRKAIPKQFLNLTGQETMLQTTVRRVAPIIPPERVFVVTGRRYTSLVAKQLPDLPARNIIAEPSGKNTAPAIGLAALHVEQLEPTATMAVLTADHIIPNETAFRAALLAADDLAQTGKLVTLGIAPTGPEIGYGYIHRGRPTVGQYQGQTAYRVNQFLEKPTLPTARQFIESGDYYWNSGMFVWQTDTFLRELQSHMADLTARLQDLRPPLFDDVSPAAVEAVWQQVRAESIDFGLMEKTDNVAVVPLDAGWNDVGSWAALYDELAETGGENVVVNADHLSIDSRDLLIEGDGRLVATIGVENLAIIQTEDALLVCAKDRTQEVKKIVDALKKQNREVYL